MKPRDTRWLSDEHCVRQFSRNCLHCCKPFHSYASGYAEEYGIYSLLASVNGVSSSYLLSEVLSSLALLNFFTQKKIADFSKLPFMLKSTLDHLNSIRESDASWCTAAETAIWNLETEHGISTKGSRGPKVRKSPSLPVQQFQVKVAIPCLDTLIANINSCFSGEVVQVVVSALVFNPALLPDDGDTSQSLW